MRRIALGVALAALLAGCGSPGAGTRVAPSASAPTGAEASATPLATPSTARATTTPVTTAPTPSVSPTPLPSLVGDRRNAWAFAPLDRPDDVVVEGEVPSQRAWSTSKVLVVAAFLTTVDGDPDRLSAGQRRTAVRALTESDLAALREVRNAIPGGAPAAMQRILRSIGDRTTVLPANLEGTMEWSVREQVRFMAALSSGEVVSPAASRFILDAMRPVESQRWGLGTIGATAYKGGWLRGNTETRQMGIVDGYAVAIITSGVGPAVVQDDGESAHVAQLDELARRLKARLGA